MTAAAQENRADPVWARAEAFPIAPEGWGWIDFNRKPHRCASADALISAIRADRDAGVAMVWLPERDHMVLPEELPAAAEAVLAARHRQATADLLDATARLRWFGGLLAGLAGYMFYQGWRFAPAIATAGERLPFALRAMLTSMSMGITLLMFLIVAFIPWYQARKCLRELHLWNDGTNTPVVPAAVIPILRFETWLHTQRAPVTKFLLVLVAMVAVAQIFCEVRTAGWGGWLALFHPWQGTAAAGLIKERYLHGEWWRLCTAPLLHGNVVHFLMNAAALLYLGKRLEVFARWPHVALVFLFAACVAGETSTRFVTAPSVGASGGLMGWLGFLLVFESLHRRLVPRTASRRLLAGVLLTGLIGLIGYRFIDNAAHFGGLLAGMLYALIVFPQSNSPNRPCTTLTDRLAGAAALAILIFSALFAVLQILAPRG